MSKNSSKDNFSSNNRPQKKLETADQTSQIGSEGREHPDDGLEVLEALAQLRKKLLDLTAHNPLISFKHGRSARYIRLIDELPDKVVQMLYDGKELTFVPVRNPSEEELQDWVAAGREMIKKKPAVTEWAESLGILVSHELPVTSTNRDARRYVDTKLQTLHYPDVLEARVGNLYRTSKMMVEETGSNPLHLAFGFLEWYEAEDSEKAHFAPLYTLPVGMAKGSINRLTNTYEYALRIREDEVQFNASIAARLQDDYGFILPTLDPERLPEEYLNCVEDAIRIGFPRWKVHRWGTLAMFNFSRLLMFRDLDPNNWPKGNSLADHPLVKAVIRGSEGDRDRDQEPDWLGSSAREYEIDDVEDVYNQFPLVDVADSSQHSALIDAIKGNNLVIQGPPGTGKSQTITNLIGAALYKGKSVLFVSEKLAALDVVKSRMERLGLGAFCLELHSHNTKKVGVVESLKLRLESRFREAPNLDAYAKRHSYLTDLLNSHAKRVNRPWKESGMSVLEVLMKCARYEKEVNQTWVDLRVEGLDGATWTPTQHADTLVEFKAYAEQVNLISSELDEEQGFDQNPWCGLHAANLDGGSVNRVMELLRQWEESLVHLIEKVDTFPGGKVIMGEWPSCDEVKKISDGIFITPPENGDIDWATLADIHARGLFEVDAIAATVDKLSERVANLGKLSLPTVLESGDLPSLEHQIRDLLVSGMLPTTNLRDLAKIGRAVEEALILINRWTERYREFLTYTGGDVPPLLDLNELSLEGLKQLKDVIEMNLLLEPGDLAFRNERLLPSKLKKGAATFKEQILQLRREREKQGALFDLAAVRAGLDIPAMIVILRETSALKRIFRRDYREARKIIKAKMHNPKTGWDATTICSVLKDLDAYLSAEKQFDSDEQWRTALGSAFQGIDTDLERFERLIVWHAILEERFTKGEDALFRDKELTDSGGWLLQANEKWVSGLQRFQEVGLTEDLDKLSELLSNIILEYGRADLPSNTKLSNAGDTWRRVLDFLETTIPAVLPKIASLGDDPPKSLEGAREVLIGYLKIRDSWWEQVAALDAVNLKYFSGRLPKTPLPTQGLRAAVSATRKWCKWLDEPGVPNHLKDEFLCRPSAEFAAALREWNELAAPLIKNERVMRSAFATFVSLEPREWSEDDSLRSLRLRIVAAANGENLLPTYLTFLRLRGILVSKGFGDICRRMEEQSPLNGNCLAIYEYLVTASLADEIFAEDESLRRFDRVLHSEKLANFKQCDHDLQKETQLRTARLVSQRSVPRGEFGARASEHTNLCLIHREIEKQKRHIPLRQLLRRAGKAVQALKPCFMMGPRSVAQYLKPGAMEFDLLVIDEASQMRPADALGAIARCKQLVVVGDSKQLAPSSFFDRMISTDDDDEEQFEANTSESILDSVAPVFSRRQLRWHYRSRHPSLIAFSNREFYDNRLMLFPSPHFSGEALGIRFNYIPDGVFENQVNMVEAQLVTDRVAELLLENPKISLGVATMNAKQRDQIEGLLEARAKADATLAEAWEHNRLEDEPLFIKNLENVQGDEREVIVISCTYGRAGPGGRVMQRFGPINSVQGGKRLNVLFTRSKARMEIYSSIQSNDIVISEKSSEGVNALRGMLRYAETGVIEGALPSGREPDSDFEVAVARMLLEHGYEVDCQIGVAGFFIDLAVKHPYKDGEYMVGIECDGAAYHSSKSARDRDRIRQDVLERMGWNIQRIWSTDWFANRERALRPILDELESQLSR